MERFWAGLRKLNKVFYSDQFGLVLAGCAGSFAYHDFLAGDFWSGMVGITLGSLIGFLAWRGLDKALRKAVRQ